ncbi:Mycinamicin III 3''-O-methyltransferase [Micromonospora sp. MW-13]|uniref:TylF/MycF/NovP-related O-methyltransferase n=1 Tax=Micromonospora sp. MW-13 TaxID=2094022 RepID=UPI000EB9B926|nr:TylF/MycF/NovP-related O-methyltransferase [Micromonospora sp. MW-13]RGC69596.1 Mycinamicin III 3''-O-methyltransferase [Micromonospora sp. MW-13]
MTGLRAPDGQDGSAGQLYLDLLKRCVTNTIYQDPPISPPWVPQAEFDPEARVAGLDCPSQAHTMVGFARLDNLRELTETVLRDEVPGDFLEAGVGRGGAMIFLRGVLKAYGVTDRSVWLADSFQGFPQPPAEARYQMSDVYPELGGEQREEQRQAAEEMKARFLKGGSEEEVRENFRRYGLLDEQVRLLPGWLAETLPTAPVRRLAILRVDNDLYASTYATLEHLYPRVSPGGYVIVDDYHFLEECRLAVHDYLKAAGEQTPDLVTIDRCGVYWRKGS